MRRSSGTFNSDLQQPPLSLSVNHEFIGVMQLYEESLLIKIKESEGQIPT